MVPPGPQLLSPEDWRATACLPSTVVPPQPSSKLFLSTVVLQRPRASGLGIIGTILAVHMDIQNKPPTDGLPPFPNRTRLSCATNLNITRLISQARDLKPAVGSPSSVLPAQRFTVCSGAHLCQLSRTASLFSSRERVLLHLFQPPDSLGAFGTGRYLKANIVQFLPCLPATDVQDKKTQVGAMT